MLDRFLSLVERDPHALAMVAGGAAISRTALLDRANEIASRLGGAAGGGAPGARPAGEDTPAPTPGRG